MNHPMLQERGRSCRGSVFQLGVSASGWLSGGSRRPGQTHLGEMVVVVVVVVVLVVHYIAVQCSAVQCSAVQCSAVPPDRQCPRLGDVTADS